MTGPDADLSWSLIARAAAGDGAARSVFGRRYLPIVRSFLHLRWGGTTLHDQIDDAVQEVFVECLRDGGALRSADPKKGDLRGLLFGVTRNVALRFERRQQRRRDGAQASDSTLARLEDRDPSAAESFDREWARGLVQLAGERMRSAAERGSAGARLRVELLRLRFTEGMPIRDIAARWEVDADSLHKSYLKARQDFRQHLRRVVGEYVVRAEADLDAEVDRVLEGLG